MTKTAKSVRGIPRTSAKAISQIKFPRPLVLGLWPDDTHTVDDENMSLHEVLAHIMTVTNLGRRPGMGRQQAKAEVVAKLRSGELTATGINSITGERETIPAEYSADFAERAR